MTEKEKTKGKIIIISGPSGVGKSTICRRVVEKTGAVLSVSATTRPIGQGEVEGKDYKFITREKFDQMIKDGQFLEYAEVFGNLYGTPQKDVEQLLAKGKTVILEIDVQGARKAKKIYPEAEMIFLLPPSQSDLVGRMTGRARGEDTKTAKKRLDSASHEIAAAWQYYDHMVINADVDQAVNEVIHIIEGKLEEKK